MDRKEMNHRLIALSERNRSRLLNAEYEVLSKPERVFRCVWELEADVNNGGFDQYFLNDSGRFVPYVVDALTTIGATKMASIVQSAIDAAGRGIRWEDDDHRQDRVIAFGQEIEDKLNKLDQQFFAYPDDLTSLLYSYVSQHREAFEVTSGSWPTDYPD
jgi:hypothetical protein